MPILKAITLFWNLLSKREVNEFHALKACQSRAGFVGPDNPVQRMDYIGERSR